MKITTAADVAAPREEVFASLNNREVLRRCIPGCEELTEADDESYHVKLKLGVAGIKGKYAGTVKHQHLQPPESFTIVFDGKGKTGWVRGTAAVRIADGPGCARIACEADVQIGGAIASVGSRLIGAAARKAARDFFQQLAVDMGVAPVVDADPLDEEVAVSELPPED